MKERIVWADALKGWLMLLVIVGHVMQQLLGDACFYNHLWNYIYSFHMPAFVAVSGWFAYRPISELWGGQILNRRFRQLLIPYFIWSLLSFIISDDLSFNHLSEIIINPSHYFWFIFVLFWIYAIFTLTRLIAIRYHLNEILLLVSICFTLSVVMVLFDLKIMSFQLLSYYFLFFIIGYVIRLKGKIPLGNVHSCIFLILIWGALGWFWNMKYPIELLNNIPYVPSIVVGYAYRGATALVAILLIFYLAPRFLNSKGSINIIAVETGKISLGIYIIHLFLLGITIYCIRLLPKDYNIYVLTLIATFILFIMSFFVVKIIQKSKTASSLLLGKV